MSNIQNDFIMIKVKIMFALWKYLASIMTIVCATGVSRAANQFSSERLLKQPSRTSFFSKIFGTLPSMGVVHSGRIWLEGITPEGP